MAIQSRIQSLLRNLFSKRAVERDLEDEVRAYVELTTDEKIAAGYSPADARRRALAEVGGSERLKGTVRESRAGSGLESLLQDLRFGVRQMVKSPGFCTTVIVTLSLSIGITAAVFSVLYAMLVRPLPYQDPERIVALDTRSASGGSQQASYPEYVDWRQMSHSFSALAGYDAGGSVTLESGTGAVSLDAVQGTDNLFDVFGVQPMLGRTFLPGEDQPGKNDVVVLGYGVWMHQFGSSAAVVGQTAKLDGRTYTVIGVMPEGFRFPINQLNAVYVPMHLTSNQKDNRGNHWMRTVGRLKPGVAYREAQADLAAVFVNLGRTDAFNAGRTIEIVDLTTYVVGSTSGALRLLLYAVLALLAIGCVNVAGLMLARGVKREREMALRSAVGASRGRILRQILTEALLFAVFGALGGVSLGYGLLKAMRMLLILSLSRGSEVSLNLPVLFTALLVSTLVTLVAALIPAMRLSGTAPTLALKSGGSAGTTRGQHRLRTGFVVTQVALALALVVVSGLLMQLLGSLRSTDLGFSADNILTTEISLPHGRYEGHDLLTSFYDPLMEKIGALPGVKAVGIIQMLPIQDWGWNSEHIHIVGTPPLRNPRTVAAETRFVSPGYYKVFQDGLVSGRYLDPGLDKSTTRMAAVVNEAFVKQFIPTGHDAVGMEIGDDANKDTMPDTDNPRILIVGVVKNMRQSLYRAPMPEMDFLVTQIPKQASMMAIGRMHLIVRTSVEPESLIGNVQRVFREVDPMLPFEAPQTMQAVIADVLTLERLENWLFGTFAAMAVLLAVVGLYGLISHEVELSTRDIGVRLALGATRGIILRGIYRRVGWMLVGGVFIGLLVTAGAQRYINSVVAVHVGKDGGLIIALAVGMILVGLLAAALPARRASSVQPMVALREE